MFFFHSECCVKSVSKMIPTIVISFLFVNFIKSTNGYNQCTSKIYKLSYGRTENLLVEAQVNVIEHENIWDYNLNITLIGHNIMERSGREISMRFKKGKQFIDYYCIKHRNGLTEAYTSQPLSHQIRGSSIYLADKLICCWIVNVNTDWQIINVNPVDSINNCDFQIYLSSNVYSALVTKNDQHFPTCNMHKCFGNEKYGNDNYSLIIRPNDQSIAFFLQVKIDDSPAVTEVVLKSSDGFRINIVCNHSQYEVFGYISDNFDLPKISLSQVNWTKITNTQCAWKLPKSITYSKKIYEIGQSEVNLSIIADNLIVFKENQLKLVKSFNKKLTNLTIIIPIVLISILMIGVMIIFSLRRKFFFHILNSIWNRVRSRSNTSVYQPQFLELYQSHILSAHLPKNR